MPVNGSVPDVDVSAIDSGALATASRTPELGCSCSCSALGDAAGFASVTGAASCTGDAGVTFVAVSWVTVPCTGAVPAT
jgi:hypothetical protein